MLKTLAMPHVIFTLFLVIGMIVETEARADEASSAQVPTRSENSPPPKASTAAVTTAAPLKLAVLGCEKAAWNDLLVARLGETKAVAIVEREKLAAVFDEKAIQGLLGSRADRGRIGRIAQADLLVLLAESETGVRLAVCDSQLGVTLQDLSVSVGEKTPENVVAALVDQTLRTVEQFKDGVKQVVAVPDFVSRDLTFEHSFLQFDYAEVLRGAFRQIPGVAIIAVDEAKAIAAERDVSGVEQKDRLVPVFIEGEYRTERGSSNFSGATVQITLRARDAAKVLLERKLHAMPLEQAGRQLLAIYTKDLAKMARAGGSAIDAGEQFRLLTQRAEEFRSLGEFRRSAALREAALLLKPDADDQRIHLVREYTRRNMQPIEFGPRPKGEIRDEKNPAWMSVVMEVVSDWKRSLQHCEYLIRNRRLCREEATDLTYNAVHSITGVRMVYSKPLDECEVVKKEFLRRAFACIPSLEPAAKTGRRGLTGALDVYHFLFTIALMRCDGEFFDKNDLELINDLLLNRLPDSMWPSYQLNFFLCDVRDLTSGKSTRYRFTEEDYQAFLDRLIASKRRLVRIYGRYGKLCYRRYDKGEKSPELLQEAQAIVAEAEKVGFDLREYDYYMLQLRNEVIRLSRELKPKAPTSTSIANRTPIVVSPPKSRVLLEPVDLTLSGPEINGQKLSRKVRWRSASGLSFILGYHPLGVGLDAFWGHGAVLFVRQPGLAEQVLAHEQLHVDDVVSDGRYVWVASSNNWGLSVLDRNGKELAHVAKDQGLPPCDHFSMVVHPLEPGRVLAAGSFGYERRGWIAIVEFDGAKANVKVIHEAIKMWDEKRSDNATNLDPAMCFVPKAIFEHVLPGSKPRRIFFILREVDGFNPLLVDLETNKVWVYPVTDWYRQCFPRVGPPADAFFSIEGVLWIAGGDRDFRSYRFDEGTGRLQVIRDKPDWHMGGVRTGSLARDGNWLYYAASNWRRINLRTGKEDLLLDDQRALPDYGRGGAWRIARSDHYGLVAFYEATLYRVRIDEKVLAPGPRRPTD